MSPFPLHTVFLGSTYSATFPMLFLQTCLSPDPCMLAVCYLFLIQRSNATTMILPDRYLSYVRLHKVFYIKKNTFSNSLLFPFTSLRQTNTPGRAGGRVTRPGLVLPDRYLSYVPSLVHSVLYKKRELTSAGRMHSYTIFDCLRDSSIVTKFFALWWAAKVSTCQTAC
jgi:hypothetical protein